jgi:hypothetical protein
VHDRQRTARSKHTKEITIFRIRKESSLKPVKPNRPCPDPVIDPLDHDKNGSLQTKYTKALGTGKTIA